MASVVEPKDAATKLGAQVDEQLAQATSRIRAHDLTFGALVLVGLVLLYATAMILLDKALNLPQWVRQLSLLGFAGALAAAAYLTVVSPLRKRINPLYAARQVENTLDDSKNSVTGYVDATQRGELNGTVRAALATRAAKAVAEADVNKAVDHRGLLYLGGAAIALFLALVVLFFVYKPAQFGSLAGRAFLPFSGGAIATRTQITLVKPEPAEPTITTGQTVTVAVSIQGKVPGADAPDRVRLLVRHNPASPEYTELPMAQGDTSRDWELRVPDYLVQTGFYYKVAAGDAETPEYRVTVRSLPLFEDRQFRVSYEYPKYLRRPGDANADPQVRAYRGTTVTLVAKTNRDVAGGTLTIDGSTKVVPGALVPDDPKSLQFKLKLDYSGKYKLTFVAADGERGEPFRSTITVLADLPPVVAVLKPEDVEGQEHALPANGQLAVDGKVGDDFGIDTVTLKMRVAGTTPRSLPDRPFLYGTAKSFKREKDGTFPTDVDYKDSVDLAALKLPPGTVVEYWLEASDNCTEPGANVGRSPVKRVRLTDPVPEMNDKGEPSRDKQNLDQQKNERKNEEQKHNEEQKQKLDKEDRSPPKNGQPEPKKGETGDAKPDNAPGEPKKDAARPEDKKDGGPEPKGNEPPKKDAPPKKDGQAQGGTGGENPMGQPPEGKKDEAPKDGGPKDKGMSNAGMPPSDPQANPMGTQDPNGPGGKAETAPMPKTPDDKNLQNKADKLDQSIKEEDKNGGAPKPAPPTADKDRTDPAQAKPQPPGADMGDKGAAETKPEPKADPAKPQGQPDAAAGKPQGNVERPDPATPKPDAPRPNDPKKGPNAPPAEAREEPLGAPPGADKPEPKEPAGAPQPQPKDKDGQPQDPKSGSTAKPGGDPPPGAAPPAEKRDPAAESGTRSKPLPDPNRGTDRPNDPAPKPDAKQPDPKQPTGDPQKGPPDAGDGKPQKAPPAGEQKPAPKDDPARPNGDGAAENKPEPKGDPTKPNGTGAAETKPEPKAGDKGPKGGGAPEAGTEKPQLKDGEKPDGGPGGAPMPKEKKLSPQEQKELQEAADNLTSPDEQKREQARQKLDKAVGPDKRKELEKLANDLQSPDEQTRKNAQQKLEEMKKQAEGKQGDKKEEGNGGAAPKGDQPDPKQGGAPKIDEKQAKEIEDAVKDLQSGDPQKQEAARKKLDKMVGEQARKDAEQLANDLKSDDKATREAAQKKLDALRKEMEQQAAKKDGKGGDPKGPTKEELDALAKQAQDLQSPDEQKRKQAQKELDEKLGKENREKLEEQLKNQKPGDPQQEQKLKEELDRMARGRPRPDDAPNPKGLGSGAPVKDKMDEDRANRLKSAELRLEQFEKRKYDEAFQRKEGFTPEEYQRFLADYERYVQKLRDDAARGVASGDKPPPATPAEAGDPLKAGGAGKVEGRPGTSSGGSNNATVDPPGFEGARDKFQKLLKEKR